MGFALGVTGLTLVAVVVMNGLRHRALRAAVQAEEQRLPGNVF